MNVTISILSYNYGRYLKQTIESALAQKADGALIEILVVDDGSTDETDNIIASYADYPNFRSSKTANLGFASTITRAIVEANGDYIFFLDSDDYFAPDKVAKMLPYLMQGYLYVSDTSIYVNEHGDVINGGAAGSTSTKAVKRSAIVPLLPVENELAFFSLHRLGQGIVLKAQYTYYRVHNNSMTDRKIPGKQQTYLARVTHKLAQKLEQLSIKNPLPPWGVSGKVIRHVSFEFKAKAYYNELEAALETKQLLKAYKKCLKMLFWSVRSQKGISTLYAKMIVRTMLFRPSIPK